MPLPRRVKAFESGEPLSSEALQANWCRAFHLSSTYWSHIGSAQAKSRGPKQEAPQAGQGWAEQGRTGQNRAEQGSDQANRQKEVAIQALAMTYLSV